MVSNNKTKGLIDHHNQNPHHFCHVYLPIYRQVDAEFLIILFGDRQQFFNFSYLFHTLIKKALNFRPRVVLAYSFRAYRFLIHDSCRNTTNYICLIFVWISQFRALYLPIGNMKCGFLSRTAIVVSVCNTHLRITTANIYSFEDITSNLSKKFYSNA